MKFFSVFALSSLFVGSIAAPAPAEKRQDVGSVLNIVTGLLSEVQQYTGVINSTATSLGPLSTLKQNQTAANTYQDKVDGLTSLVQGTVTKVTSLQQTAGGLTSRADDANAIAGVLSNVLLEVNGAMNNVDGTLGLGSLLGLATPLTDTLSGLLDGVESLVGGVLSLVEGLLGGVLKTLGLSNALNGLVGSNGILSGLLGGTLGNSSDGLLGAL
ncbi:adsorption protein [Diplodia corticola]|uniref:Adsorption protein n=1 Tax=Diplodia corticola TaxID=236234 RepID=A0A1J9R4G7_9PEZI|nr:adsorption protein [Diplodia corticola]OJD35496.1 adsorption protein [Diplodia corticola]